MDASSLEPYVVPAAIAAWFGWRFLKFRAAKARLPGLLRRGAVVVDVRSPEEFASGARPGSLNIPLGALEGRVKELDAAKPVIVCCASGARSAMAAGILARHGFKQVLNAGPWRNTLSS